MLSLVGAFGAAACLEATARSMRAVMKVGGYCAEGGPYQIAVHCPRGTVWLTLVSVFAGIAFTVLFFAFLPIRSPGLGFLVWSAPFLALGWEFIDAGFPWHGQHAKPGFLVPGLIFVIVGAAPAYFWIRAIVNAILGREAPDTAAGVKTAIVVPANLSGVEVPTATASEAPGLELAADLSRLSDLHRSGELSDGEYEVAKQHLLGESR